MELRERKGEKEELESLKDKLKVKWHQRDFTMKKEDSDKAAMKFFFAMWFSLLFECMIWLIPHAFSETKWFMWLGTIVLFGEVMINWHRSYFDTANYVTAETKQKVFPDSTETPPEWRNCIKCQVDAPPRSHHCQFCGKCMLKRVQHCFLTGSCVGFHNQKYFVVFCLWTLIGTSYCMYLQLSYLNMDLPLNSADFITYIPPVTLHKLVMGYISFGQAFLVSHFFVCVPAFVMSLFFLLWHILLSVEGVTAHEAWKGNFGFKCSRIENIKSVFGSFLYIPLLFIYPFRFEQLGDGIQWKYRYKRVKGN